MKVLISMDAYEDDIILLVEPHHSMGGRSGAGKEIDYSGFRLFLHEESQCVFNSIQTLGEGKSPRGK